MIAAGHLMLFIAAILLVLVAVLAITRLRLPFTADADLGWMSDQWLAEQRASHFH
jgi:hypothetical protein